MVGDLKEILLNSKKYLTKSSNLNELKAELGNDENTIVIYKGFAVSENLDLENGDEVVFIKKGQMPPKDELRAMIRARNTPFVNEALESAKIGIAGLGGLGSNVAIALARLCVGRLKLVDFDIVEPSNLNRQQYYVSDIGKFKAHALAEKISQINPFTKVECEVVRLESDNINLVFKDYDIVCECFDNPKSKAMLINSLKDKKIVAASGMAGFESSNSIKTQKFANNLYLCGDLVSSAQIGQGLMAPRVMVCAAHQANMALRLVLGIDEI